MYDRVLGFLGTYKKLIFYIDMESDIMYNI